MTETTFEQTRSVFAADEPTLLTANGLAVYYAAKRAFDVIVAAIALVLLAPLLLLVAVLIKLDSSGPVLFSQTRVGSRRYRDGWKLHTFRVHKFRSMVHDADPAVHVAHVNAFVHGRLEGARGTGPAFKLQNDRRITRVGAILRRTSIDELPQLINVLRGEMSLVGPRPVPPYEVSHYDQTHFARFGASPGITGLWQVSGRCAVSFDEMVRLDLEYITKQSLALDLKILLLTVPAIVSGRGAA